MKTKSNTVLMVLILLVYLSGLRAANAFYDPGTQRWLNRDPLGEAGGINLFAFAENDSINLADPDGLLPASSQVCQALAKKIKNLEDEVRKRTRELYEDPQNLPGKLPGDNNKPSISRRGHQMLLNKAKANLAAAKAKHSAYCNDPEDPTLKKCFNEAVEAIPLSPTTLEQAGVVAGEVGIGILSGLGGGRGGGIRPIPRPRPQPDPIFPTPEPAFP